MQFNFFANAPSLCVLHSSKTVRRVRDEIESQGQGDTATGTARDGADRQRSGAAGYGAGKLPDVNKDKKTGSEAQGSAVFAVMPHSPPNEFLSEELQVSHAFEAVKCSDVALLSATLETLTEGVVKRLTRPNCEAFVDGGIPIRRSAGTFGPDRREMNLLNTEFESRAEAHEEEENSAVKSARMFISTCVDEAGMSLLHLAAFYGSISVVRYLIALGEALSPSLSLSGTATTIIKTLHTEEKVGEEYRTAAYPVRGREHAGPGPGPQEGRSESQREREESGLGVSITGQWTSPSSRPNNGSPRHFRQRKPRRNDGVVTARPSSVNRPESEGESESEVVGVGSSYYISPHGEGEGEGATEVRVMVPSEGARVGTGAMEVASMSLHHGDHSDKERDNTSALEREGPTASYIQSATLNIESSAPAELSEICVNSGNRELSLGSKYGSKRGNSLVEAMVNAFNQMNGQAPLHLAAYGGHHEIVELLCKYGADPFATTKQESTPLHMVSAAPCSGGSSNAATGGTSASVAATHTATHTHTPSISPLSLRLRPNPPKTARALLLAAERWGRDRDTTARQPLSVALDCPNKWGVTPLMSTAFKGNLAVASALIEHGANPLLVCKNGKSARDTALEQGHAALVSLFDTKKSIVQQVSSAVTGVGSATEIRGHDENEELERFAPPPPPRTSPQVIVPHLAAVPPALPTLHHDHHLPQMTHHDHHLSQTQACGPQALKAETATPSRSAVSAALTPSEDRNTTDPFANTTTLSIAENEQSMNEHRLGGAVTVRVMRGHLSTSTAEDTDERASDTEREREVGKVSRNGATGAADMGLGGSARDEAHEAGGDAERASSKAPKSETIKDLEREQVSLRKALSSSSDASPSPRPTGSHSTTQPSLGKLNIADIDMPPPSTLTSTGTSSSVPTGDTSGTQRVAGEGEEWSSSSGDGRSRSTLNPDADGNDGTQFLDDQTSSSECKSTSTEKDNTTDPGPLKNGALQDSSDGFSDTKEQNENENELRPEIDTVKPHTKNEGGVVNCVTASSDIDKPSTGEMSLSVSQNLSLAPRQGRPKTKRCGGKRVPKAKICDATTISTVKKGIEESKDEAEKVMVVGCSPQKA